MIIVGRRHYKTSGDGYIALAIIGLLALPIWGLIKITKGDTDEEKGLGALMLIGGIVLWIIIGVIGS